MLLDLYDSISRLNYDKKNFEWVIVNDGSTDNTEDILREFVDNNDNNINITVIKKKNGGKHTAWRLATPIFKGQYVITIDDDDLISADALLAFDYYWKLFEHEPDYDEIWELRARCQTKDGKLVGDPSPTPFIKTDYIQLSYVQRQACEMCSCRKIEVLVSEAAVPDHFVYEDKCSNFAENIRWIRAARKYKSIIIPVIARTYVIGHESLCLTLKGSKRPLQKIYNNIVSSVFLLNEQKDLMISYDINRYFITMLRLSINSIRANCILDNIKLLNRASDKVVYAFSIPVAIIIDLFRK